MDRHDHKGTKCSINLNEVISFRNGDEKKKVARKRWGILAKALKSPTDSEPTSPTDEISLRRISSFMLLTTQQLAVPPPILTTDSRLIENSKKRTWFKYSLFVNNQEYSVNVGHRNRNFSAEDLMGFNNTGNVCIWPSEETLAYYICNKLTMFNDKTVLELGGGMACLAGLFACKYGQPKFVSVTDGNRMSIENVTTTAHCNEFQCPIECKVLKWGSSGENSVQFDVILCADCLFFDEGRADLIECLWNCLTVKGVALIMAPERGNTLSNFLEHSRTKGFRYEKIVNYNEHVWQKRLSLLNNCEFDDNIHYPILIKLTKF